MISKKAFLKAYADVSKTIEQEADHNPLYKSKQDEMIIKDYHYAKFRKNLASTQDSPELQALLNKEDWSEEDTQSLLALLR